MIFNIARKAAKIAKDTNYYYKRLCALASVLEALLIQILHLDIGYAG